MTDHLAEARRITEGQTAYDSTALSYGILHALIAVAERLDPMGAPRARGPVEPECPPEFRAQMRAQLTARHTDHTLPTGDPT